MTSNNGHSTDARSDLFLGEGALAELDALITSAIAGGASRLLILAGKPVVCRIDGKLSDPLLPGRVHFSQTERLVASLLTAEQHATLDKDGAVEIDYSPGTAITGSNGAAVSSLVKINVFFGDAAHNLVVFFEE